jgi:DNA-binding MarR family transcriptional regulator
LDVTPLLLQAIRSEMRSMRTADLTVPQFRTLSYLDNNPGASLSAVAEFIGLTLSSMSILVNALVDRALVERTTDNEDRRRVHLTVTPSGHTMLQNALQATEARLAESVAGLTDSERATIVEGFELLRPLFAPGTPALQPDVAPHDATLEGHAAP